MQHNSAAFPGGKAGRHCCCLLTVLILEKPLHSQQLSGNTIRLHCCSSVYFKVFMVSHIIIVSGEGSPFCLSSSCFLQRSAFQASPCLCRLGCCDTASINTQIYSYTHNETCSHINCVQPLSPNAFS